MVRRQDRQRGQILRGIPQDTPDEERERHLFTVEGRVTDEDALRREIYERLKPFFQTGLTKRVANLLEALRLEACAPDLPIKRDRICTGGENLFRGRRSV